MLFISHCWWTVRRRWSRWGWRDGPVWPCNGRRWVVSRGSCPAGSRRRVRPLSGHSFSCTTKRMGNLKVSIRNGFWLSPPTHWLFSLGNKTVAKAQSSPYYQLLPPIHYSAPKNTPYDYYHTAIGVFLGFLKNTWTQRDKGHQNPYSYYGGSYAWPNSWYWSLFRVSTVTWFC